MLDIDILIVKRNGIKSFVTGKLTIRRFGISKEYQYSKFLNYFLTLLNEDSEMLHLYY